jgi:hypothetical protein
MRKRIEPALQADPQTLWRGVIQSTGSTLLWVLILLVLGGLYLSVSAKAASAGRLVITLSDELEEVRQTYSEVVARHALATSPQRMRELASSLGYRPAEIDEVRFLRTNLIQERLSFQAPVPQSVGAARKTTLSPAYTETLMDWAKRFFGVGGAK